MNAERRILDRFSLADKIALVSGASRGIGEAVAHGLAEQGARVIVSSRRLAACEAVADAIRQRGFDAVATACHAGKMEDIDALFAMIEQDFGRLDVLVNNGGTNPYFGPIADTELAAFEKTMEVNFRGPFFMSARAAKIMAANGGGSIVNVASVYGLTPGVHQGIYSQTKAAMINMTAAFAREHGRDGIRVNALAPGLVDTRMTAVFKRDPDALAQVLGSWPIPRMAQPEEMVAAVLLLASDASSFMTGQTVVVDGGASLDTM